jgi:hypothetical protein
MKLLSIFLVMLSYNAFASTGPADRNDPCAVAVQDHVWADLNTKNPQGAFEIKHIKQNDKNRNVYDVIYVEVIPQLDGTTNSCKAIELVTVKHTDHTCVAVRSDLYKRDCDIADSEAFEKIDRLKPFRGSLEKMTEAQKDRFITGSAEPNILIKNAVIERVDAGTDLQSFLGSLLPKQFERVGLSQITQTLLQSGIWNKDKPARYFPGFYEIEPLTQYLARIMGEDGSCLMGEWTTKSFEGPTAWIDSGVSIVCLQSNDRYGRAVLIWQTTKQGGP